MCEVGPGVLLAKDDGRLQKVRAAVPKLPASIGEVPASRRPEGNLHRRTTPVGLFDRLDPRHHS